MAEKNYYETLGVTKNSTADEIKKAYRKLALEWHPDRHQGSGKEDAEKKFKEINEAYQVLSDPNKRQSYDRFGQAGVGGASGNPFAGAGGQWGPFSYSYSQQGGQSPFGGFDFGDPVDIFEQFFGGARTPRKPRYSFRVSFLDAALGGEKIVEIEGKKKTIKIPAGVDNGSRIDFPDFQLTIEVAPSADFQREGSDIYGAAYVPFSTMALGGTADIKTIHGTVSVKIRAATKSGATMRLKGKGAKQLRGSAHGDHYVTLHVEVPEKMSREQRGVINDLKKSGF